MYKNWMDTACGVTFPAVYIQQKDFSCFARIVQHKNNETLIYSIIHSGNLKWPSSGNLLNTVPSPGTRLNEAVNAKPMALVDQR